MTTLAPKRIESIDILRGIIMVIMALDHVRDYVHISANVDDPLNLATTTPALYATRWITHLCAPLFVFLSGVSIYLQGLKKSSQQLGSFLVKRGLWLIVAECVIISFAWTFNPFFNVIAFQVIWAIGISMVIIGLLLLVKVPYKLLLVLGLMIVFGHNALDFIEKAPGFKANFWWDLLHSGSFAFYPYAPNHFLIIAYPFLPWTGLMLLGYCAGIWFTTDYAAAKRKKILLQTGTALILFFVALRFANFYGDPKPWTTQKNSLYTFLSFMDVHKYPPSLLYHSITIGIGLLALAGIENIKNRFTNIMQVFGRTAFFYYILHLYLIHLVATIIFFANGHTMQDAFNLAQNMPFLFVAPGEGFNLPMTYLVWISVVVALYPLCNWYNNYKTKHKEKWWLSYL
jgi:uncharacterized membrane protein